MNETRVTIDLTADEAPVLLEFASRYSDDDRLSIVDQSEQRALRNLCCLLEKKVAGRAINNPNYERELAEAQQRLRDPTDE